MARAAGPDPKTRTSHSSHDVVGTRDELSAAAAAADGDIAVLVVLPVTTSLEEGEGRPPPREGNEDVDRDDAIIRSKTIGNREGVGATKATTVDGLKTATTVAVAAMRRRSNVIATYIIGLFPPMKYFLDDHYDDV